MLCPWDHVSRGIAIGRVVVVVLTGFNTILSTLIVRLWRPDTRRFRFRQAALVRDTLMIG